MNQHGALAKAIASAAMEAAGDITEPTFYEVVEILIEVRPNPGPTAYKIAIRPK